MTLKVCPTVAATIYMSGPINVAAQVIRAECLREGLCVTLTPTTYIYSGGEEAGFIVGLTNYPRFPTDAAALTARARTLRDLLLAGTCQHSALLVLPAGDTEWVTTREQA